MKWFTVMTLVVVFGCVTTVHADSIFSKRAAESGTLISKQKQRFEVGDMITVLVRESIDAQTQSDLDTKKESTVKSAAAAAANTFFMKDGGSRVGFLKEGDLPNWDVESEAETKADGSTSRGNTITTTITCLVTRVQNNGVIYVEGEKNLTVNRETSLLKVAGLVRSKDVTSTNTIQSNQMANAMFNLTGDGPLWNNQRRGFLTKFFDFFSPN